MPRDMVPLEQAMRARNASCPMHARSARTETLALIPEPWVHGLLAPGRA